jgi:hypothetical protein
LSQAEPPFNDDSVFDIVCRVEFRLLHAGTGRQDRVARARIC